jgi:hypothetical protein
VADQTQAGWRSDTELALHERIDDLPQIMEFGGKGVVPETVGEGELPGIVDSTATEVGTYRRKTSLGQALGKGGKHPPVLEALESVDNHNRRTRGAPSTGAYVDEDVTQGPGKGVFGKGGRRHR